jgi:pimeloyl-ACP methyl ester carboxylesterase
MPAFASYDGTKLAWTEVGSGAPLVCVPGGPGRAAEYLEDLGGVQRTLIRLDSRATGHSEVPADPGTLRYDRLADDLEALREHLGLATMDVCGHSAGCIVTQVWAARHPDRVGRLLLLTPSGALQGNRRADVPGIRAARSGEPWYAEAAEAQADLADAPPAFQQQLVRLTRPFFYGRWDERTQAHADSADRQSTRRATEGFAIGAEEVDKAAILAGLAAVTAPVLVVGAERDALTGVEAIHDVAASFPNASTVVLERAGHFPWVDEPEALVAAVAPFLAG